MLLLLTKKRANVAVLLSMQSSPRELRILETLGELGFKLSVTPIGDAA
jgi:hypothetical protein